MIIFAVEIEKLIYTMSISSGTKINQLLAATAPTGLIFSDWMKKNGYSVQLQKIQGYRVADHPVQGSHVPDRQSP